MCCWAATPHELDFVVEGDAVAVARRAAERLGGRVIVHERFGTATVEAPDATFDLAGARRERYERPGALPDVELGASLRRRPRAPRLHRQRDRAAPDRRRADASHPGRRRTWRRAAARAARPLVPRRPDAAAAARALRRPARVRTRARRRRLAAEAIAGGALDTVTGSRLGAELRLLLGEPQPAALLALERHGLGRALLGHDFAVDDEPSRRALTLTPSTAADLAAFADDVLTRRGSTSSRSRRTSATSWPRVRRCSRAP